MKDVIVVVGAGSIGQAIARRVGAGRHVLLASLHEQDAAVAAQAFGNAGYDVSVAGVDISSRDSVRALVKNATGLGSVTGLIHAAGVSPSQASPATILRVDLYGTALVLELFGEVIARGGSGVVISSQSGHRLPALTPAQDQALATTPVEALLQLDLLQAERVTDPLLAYQLSKRGNALRVMAEAVRWGRSPRADDVVIEILYCGICHSDVHNVRNDWGNAQYPMVPGHEIIGRVVGVGAGVTRFTAGDRVGVGCLVDACQHCAACGKGWEQYCENGATYTYNGTDPVDGSRTHGGYAEKIVVKQDFVLKVPDQLDPAGAAPLLCAGITTYSPLRHWNVGAGSRVAIVGLGGLGHMGLKLAKAMGAEVRAAST